MLDGQLSGCINHPAIEAVARCKQCGTPVCRNCIVSALSGRFCSQACREKYDAFAQRAQAMEQAGATYRGRSRTIHWPLIIFVALVVLAGVVIAAGYFDLPVLGPKVRYIFYTLRSTYKF